MSRTFLVEFEERKSQVRRYLAVVLRLERDLRWATSGSAINSNRLNVLRAGTFLILYNMVESAARMSVQAIHDDMTQKAIPFQRLRRSLRKEVVRGFKKRGSLEVHQDMKDVPVELVTASLDVEEHFSGNVDAKRLRDIAEIYGFRIDSVPATMRNGADLLTIKTIRNDLAHGFKTYEEVGRDYPIRELLAVSIRATAYMSVVLRSISSYLDRERFLEDAEANEVA